MATLEVEQGEQWLWHRAGGERREQSEGGVYGV